MRKLQLIYRKMRKILRFNVSMGSKLTYRLKKSLLRTAKGGSALRHREKQRAKAEIVRKSGLVSEFNKMVSKSSKHGKTLKPFQCPFSVIVITTLRKPSLKCGSYRKNAI